MSHSSAPLGEGWGLRRTQEQKSDASTPTAKKSYQIFRNSRWLLRRSEMTAAWEHGPALNVVDALQVRTRRLALGNGLAREDAERCGCLDVAALDRMPAIIPVISHRRGDSLRDP